MGSVGAYKRLFVISRVKGTINWSSLESAVFGCVGLPLRQDNRFFAGFSKICEKLPQLLPQQVVVRPKSRRTETVHDKLKRASLRRVFHFKRALWSRQPYCALGDYPWRGLVESQLA